MKVLGIDPGIDLIGFAVADIQGSRYTLLSCGVIRTDRSLHTAARLVQIRDDLQELLAAHPGLQAAGVEELFFAKNVTTAAAVWQARGVIIECLERSGIGTVLDIKPNQVKMAVTGNGASGKAEVQTMVKITFGLGDIPKPDDAADAAAVALATEALLRTAGNPVQLEV